MRVNRIFLLFLLIGMVWSCKKDDDPGFETIPPRALDEVALENDASIKEFLATHFYNYEEFANPSADFDYKIKIDTIAGENANKTPLMQQVQSETVTVTNTDLGLESEQSVQHTYYYLIAREGEGERPTVADSTYIRYEGSLLNGTVFDGTADYSWQYLPFFLRGYSRGISQMKAGDNIVVNNDGTTRITNSGIGMVIMPSGLGYFNQIQGGISQYSPLIFKLDVGLMVPDTDYDNDGIPSILEDLNGDGNLNNDNTDREAEVKARTGLIPNHQDQDDDGDGTPTREEIIIDANGNITFPDTDGDGIPDYLDKDTK
ncbi:FKBP-type peptidyl-prolyl cis-trans isomerase [Sediminicola sp. 1XM1-17]|uniref:FKBP-type peptidyl-prolyl cis-trans isomerase n=1 Tax=Sediminicola sp. 1XM1-17 TaxID=3127702 RepID=UPI0030774C75